MIKSCKAVVKAAGEADGLNPGQFTAYASVFGNVDSYGDVVVKGAFADTLVEWKASGAPIPLYWSHLMGGDPEMNLGEIISAEEDDKGLLVTAQLDIADNPKAAYVYKLLKGRRVQQMSFAYDVLDAAPGKSGDLDVVELRALKLHEVSVVPIGANQETEILAVKAAAEALKEGRVLATKHIDSLRTARDAISAVIAAAEQTEEGKASGAGPAKDAKAPEEPSRKSPTVDSVAVTLSLLALKGVTN